MINAGLPPSGFKKIPELSVQATPTEKNGKDTGVKEANLLGNDLDEDQIRRRSATNEHKRSENFKNHFERIALCGMWTVASIAAVLTVLLVYHLIMPTSCHWLTPNQTDKIWSFLSGGVIASVATGHFKKRLG
ncbi:hypothetical protein ACLBWS_05220 [Brucellaceae bacterium D45D]